MTKEQREHIVATIGILDMGAALLRTEGFIYAAAVMVRQAEILKEVLDNDAGDF